MYEWVPSSAYSGVPPNALQAGHDIDGSTIYVGRAFHEGDWIAAKVERYDFHRCFVFIDPLPFIICPVIGYSKQTCGIYTLRGRRSGKTTLRCNFSLRKQIDLFMFD